MGDVVTRSVTGVKNNDSRITGTIDDRTRYLLGHIIPYLVEAGGNVPHVLSAVLVAGETQLRVYTDGEVSSVVCYDNATGDVLLTDVKIGERSFEVAIAQPYENDIAVVYQYVKG